MLGLRAGGGAATVRAQMILRLLFVFALGSSAAFAQAPKPAKPGTPAPVEKVVRDGDLLRPQKEAANDTALPGKLLNALTDAEMDAGWQLLFNGKAATGLRGLTKANAFQSGWSVDKGALVLTKDIKTQGKVTGGDLVANVAFDDFEFSFEWKVEVSGDTGVMYFTRGAMGMKPQGLEYQIIDDVHHPDGLKGGPIKQTGALYGILPAPALAEKTVNQAGQWNEGRIVVQGQHVEHWLNGAKLLEFNLGPELAKAALAAKARMPAGFERKIKAPVVLLDQGEGVAFRNLKIRPLPSAAPAK
jgi:hypothetical protein